MRHRLAGLEALIDMAFYEARFGTTLCNVLIHAESRANGRAFRAELFVMREDRMIYPISDAAGRHEQLIGASEATVLAQARDALRKRFGAQEGKLRIV